jgi:hypothetical protein
VERNPLRTNKKWNGPSGQQSSASLWKVPTSLKEERRKQVQHKLWYSHTRIKLLNGPRTTRTNLLLFRVCSALSALEQQLPCFNHLTPYSYIDFFLQWYRPSLRGARYHVIIGDPIVVNAERYKLKHNSHWYVLMTSEAETDLRSGEFSLPWTVHGVPLQITVSWLVQTTKRSPVTSLYDFRLSISHTKGCSRYDLA